MSIGDRVVVIDLTSPRHGRWGIIVDLTKQGDLCVDFFDAVEVLGPFQVESDPRLARAALTRAGFEVPLVRTA